MEKNVRNVLSVVFGAMALCCLISCNNTESDSAVASRCFKDLKRELKRDNGDLWGRQLYAPTFVVNTETGEIIADRQDSLGLFRPGENGIYCGVMPAECNPANSVIDLGGMRWVMVLWPLPDTKFERNVLLTHETFHYWQPALGLNPQMDLCSHLDSETSRIYLKLEWNALEAAVQAETEEGTEIAVSHALAFRRARFCATSDSNKTMEDERAMLLLEGLPEYTAYKICCHSDGQMKESILKSRQNHWNNDSYVYSFAYHTGLAYGYLLDKLGLDWREGLDESSSLTDIAAEAIHATPSVNTDSIAQLYGQDTIEAYEHIRALNMAKVKEAYCHLFTGDTIMSLTFGNVSMGFHPAKVIDLAGFGTVYPNIRLTGDFGILDVRDGGCLMHPNWDAADVSAKGITITADSLYTANWTFYPAEGISVVAPDAQHPLQYQVKYK